MAMGSIRTTVRAFLSNQIMKVRPDGGYCNRVVIRHVNVEGQPGRDVQTFPLEERLGKEGLEMLTDEILSACQADADGLGRKIQRYGIFTYFTGEHPQGGSRAFMLQGEGTTESDETFEDTEPATGKGLLSQLMRHNEGNARTSTLAMGGVVRHQAQTIDRITAQNEALQDKLMSMHELMDDLQSTKHERDMAIRKIEHQEKLTMELFDKIKILLPVIANKTLGKTVFPEAEDPRVLVVKEWAESLTTTQVESLRKILKPEQTIALLDALEKSQEDKLRPVQKLKAVGEDEKP